MRLREVDLDFLINHNEQLRKPVQYHHKRDDFFNLLSTKPFNVAVDQYIAKPSRIKRLASRLLSPNSKRIIRKIIWS